MIKKLLAGAGILVSLLIVVGLTLFQGSMLHVGTRQPPHPPEPFQYPVASPAPSAASGTLLEVANPGNSRDTSAVDVAVDANATFLITDFAGRRTGSEPHTGHPLEEIPGSTYLEDRVGDEPSRFAHIDQPGQGLYSIVLTGTRDGAYELSVRSFSRNGSAQVPLVAKGEIGAGAQVRLVLDFSLSLGQDSSLTTISTSDGQVGQ